MKRDRFFKNFLKNREKMKLLPMPTTCRDLLKLKEREGSGWGFPRTVSEVAQGRGTGAGL